MSYKLKLYYLCCLTNINSSAINENIKKSLLCFGIPIGGFTVIYLITKIKKTKPESENKKENNIQNTEDTDSPNINITNTFKKKPSTSNIEKKIQEIYENNIDFSSDFPTKNIDFNFIEEKLTQLKNTEKTGLENIDLEIQTIKKVQSNNLQLISDELIKIIEEEEQKSLEEMNKLEKLNPNISEDEAIKKIFPIITKRMESRILNMYNKYIPQSQYLNFLKEKFALFLEKEIEKTLKDLEKNFTKK